MAGGVSSTAVIKLFSSFIAALLLITPSLLAQGGAPGVANVSFLRLFGKENFSAKAQLDMLDEAGKIIMTVENMNMVFLDGNFRADVDMAKIKGPGLSEDEIAEMKQAGMDRATTIMRQDLKKMYLIYPGLKAYADISLPAEAATASGHEPKITKSPQGKETINGHPCTKSKVTLTDQQGKQEEMTVWEAADLKDLPVQVQLKEKGQVLVIQFKEVRQSKPEASQFEPPEGFARYNDIKTLMMQRMKGADTQK